LGLGTALVRTGFDRLKEQGVEHVFVLGDPAYYSRFGFAPERRATPPFPIPDAWSEAWQSAPLVSDVPAPDGPISLPAPWMRPALWTP
jgi:predicted N-acetyltransferase YhbS